MFTLTTVVALILIAIPLISMPVAIAVHKKYDSRTTAVEKGILLLVLSVVNTVYVALVLVMLQDGLLKADDSVCYRDDYARMVCTPTK
jgi:hypothetical protein